MVTNIIARGLLVMNLGISINVVAMQEGTLRLKNLSGIAVALKVVVMLENGIISKKQADGSIKEFSLACAGKKISIPDDKDKWLPLDNGKQLELNSRVRIDEKFGGKGSLWGSQTHVLLLNREIMKVDTFILSKITEYAVKLNEQKKFILVDRVSGQAIEAS